ncbi:MAG: SDR family oxidoreductase [Fimbriiglobus sp.]|jgi:NAD(P)-dependent dehydrogenase (short-subunit alcohol dehydrogenase family)|nr:SDR family oxidoreductase [Fimbriiglobus sp.]
MDNKPAYVIVGAAGGIGSVVCRRLAKSGARILLVGRTADKLQSLAEELQSLDPAGQFIPFAADATKSAEVDAAFAKAVELFGTLSGAANLVGSILLKPAHLTTDAELEDTLSLNTRSAFYTVRAAAKAMMNTGGSVVLASTVAATIGLTNHEAIATAKGAVNGLVLSAAATYAPRNIRVNAVAPGLVKTPLAAKITGNELALKASTAMHPLGRVGEPDDVAACVAWLLDPNTTWVTGQVIGIDGGLGKVKAK